MKSSIAARFDPAAPDAVLNFMRLIWAVDHELHGISKRMEGELGLTVPQRLALLLIARTPGTLGGELAEFLHLHPGTVSGVIARLESAGFVRREADDEDARRLRLHLTAKGKHAHERKAGTFEGAVRRVLADSTTADLAAAARVLSKLAKELSLP